MDGRVAAGRGDDVTMTFGGACGACWPGWTMIVVLGCCPLAVGVGVGELESAVLLAAGLAQAAANAQDTMIRDDR